MIRIRMFHGDGSYTDWEDTTTTRELSITRAKELVSLSHMRTLVMQKIRGRWHVCFDSDNGY